MKLKEFVNRNHLPISLAANFILGASLGFASGWILHKPSSVTPNVVNVVGSADEIFVTGQMETIPLDNNRDPVIMGERIAMKRDYIVLNSEDVLNSIQYIGGKDYKINYSDRYHPVKLSMPGSWAFVLHDNTAAEKVFTQFVFPMNGLTESMTYSDILPDISVESLSKYLPEQFNEVSDIKVEGNQISFIATGIQLSGYWKTTVCESGEKFAILSMQEGTIEPDIYCKNYLESMWKSVDRYYNQYYPKPVRIENAIVDKSAYMAGHHFALATPRTGFDIVTNEHYYTFLQMHDIETFGNNKVLIVTSNRDIYGLSEALEKIPYDIASAFDTFSGVKGNNVVVTVTRTADWCSSDAYYIEGVLADKRIVAYIFYNPVLNNFSSISAIVDDTVQGQNCEKLLNSMSERIDFINEVN